MELLLMTEYLPAILRLIAEEIGHKEALKLASEYGGQNIYIPQKLKKESSLYEHLGEDILIILIENYAGEKIDIPLYKTGRFHEISQEIKERVKKSEKSNNELAQELGVTARTIRRYRNKEEKGLPLFELTKDK